MVEAAGEIAMAVLPAHVGEVFREGRNVIYTVDRFGNTIPGLEIRTVKDALHRRAWVFGNMRSFNKLNGANRLWRGALADYIGDLNEAKTNAIREMSTTSDPTKSSLREETEAFDDEVGETEKLLISFMAVSSAARAIDASAGVPKNYIADVTGTSPEGPDMDKQANILAGNPERYVRAIGDPLVRHYYDRIMRASGIDMDSSLEWHKGADGWVGSAVRLSRSAREIRDDRNNPNSLVYYLHNKAKNGGFDAYIKKVLLKEDSDDFIVEQYGERIDDPARESAARIAADAFIVDKFTRWSYLLTMVDENTLKHGLEADIYGEKPISLFPSGDWAGDPFFGVLKISFLTGVIKGMYADKANNILRWADLGFRPYTIFTPSTGVDSKLARKMLSPTAVENLKAYGRFCEAGELYFGGSRGQELKVTDVRSIGEKLAKIPELIDQVYGNIDYPNKDEGKHIEGYMFSVLLYAKALAFKISRDNPAFFSDVFGQVVDSRKPDSLREFREFLFGGSLDYREGLIAELSSGRTQIVFRGNRHGAEEYLQKTYDLLASPSESGTRKGLKAAVVVSTAFAPKR